jgi:hypothetical protein
VRAELKRIARDSGDTHTTAENQERTARTSGRRKRLMVAVVGLAVLALVAIAWRATRSFGGPVTLASEYVQLTNFTDTCSISACPLTDGWSPSSAPGSSTSRGSATCTEQVSALPPGAVRQTLARQSSWTERCMWRRRMVTRWQMDVLQHHRGRRLTPLATTLSRRATRASHLWAH